MRLTFAQADANINDLLYVACVIGGGGGGGGGGIFIYSCLHTVKTLNFERNPSGIPPPPQIIVLATALFVRRMRLTLNMSTSTLAMKIIQKYLQRV